MNEQPAAEQPAAAQPGLPDPSGTKMIIYACYSLVLAAIGLYLIVGDVSTGVFPDRADRQAAFLAAAGGVVGGATFTFYELAGRMGGKITRLSRGYFGFVYGLGPWIAVIVSLIYWILIRVNVPSIGLEDIQIKDNLSSQDVITWPAQGILVGLAWQRVLAGLVSR